MRGARQALPDEPTLPDESIRKLRAAIILEEALETVKALGFDPVLALRDQPSRPALALQTVTIKDITFYSHGAPDLPEIADGCADISVVTTGTLAACGIADKPLLRLVDENNLAKLAPGHSFRSDGKLLKPPGHKRPDFAAALREQGWKG